MSRPLVVAHRGSSARWPEHTLHAYEQALEDGADALECDVRLTADGHLVCVHDRRIDRTSSGRGVVSTKTLAELEREDFVSWRAPVDGAPLVVDDVRRRVLTFDRLLELVVESPRTVGLSVETKHPTRYAGLVEERVVEALRRFGLVLPRRRDDDSAANVVRVMSFSEVAIRRLRMLAPGLPTVFLMDRVPLRFRDGSLPFAAPAAGPSIEILRAHPRYVARAHARGHEVHVWTVDAPADIELCVRLGVDAIITNEPARVSAALPA